MIKLKNVPREKLLEEFKTKLWAVPVGCWFKFPEWDRTSWYRLNSKKSGLGNTVKCNLTAINNIEYPNWTGPNKICLVRKEKP